MQIYSLWLGTRSCSIPTGFYACFLIVLGFSFARGQDAPRLTLRGETATVSFALAGGSLIDFRVTDSKINPLNWELSPETGPAALVAKPQGHFLCLDRWGPPTRTEIAKGIPFHGEASHVMWQIKQPSVLQGDRWQATMGCELPLAALKVERQVTLESMSSVLIVTEKVTNTGNFGRIYNMVQHPSIAPPFLDETTRVDSNAVHGFSQQGPIPKSRASASQWPNVESGNDLVDLRYYKGDAKEASDVSSFIFADETKYGWVTAYHAGSRFLIGYMWQTADYPWLNIWRSRQRSRVVARGLEFGTTGYHQPYPTLVRQQQILDRSLFQFLDADETQSRAYVAFVASLPENFKGVASVEYKEGALRILESKDTDPRVLIVKLSALPWQ